MSLNTRLHALLWLLLPLLTTQKCGPGTLRCNSPGDSANERALICDPSLNYVLFDNSCIQQNIPNCLLTLNENECKVCRYSYYLTNDRKCAGVPRNTPSEIFNCNFYNSIDSCKACNINSYLRNGICRPATGKIENCTLMDDKDSCEICDLKLPTYNQTFCNEVDQSAFDKCLFMRHPVGCKQCQPGYQKDLNYFLNFLSDEDIHKGFFEKVGFWRDSFFDIVYNIPSCKFEYMIQDCAELDYDNKCKRCIDGFSLSPEKDRCFVKPSPPRNPKDRIPNCFKFKTENYEECDLCYEGYYLKDNNTKCIKHSTDIPGCNVYSQTEENRCVFCSNITYRSNSIVIESQCGNRDNYFENCERYSRTGDQCLECAAEHIFHFDNKRCSLQIENCNQYNTSLRILQCSDCIDSHYLNNDSTLCFDANNAINGCQKYDKGPSCSICKQGFYLDLDSKTCFFHDTFLQCKNLSVTTKNICDECEEQGVRTQKTHECTPVSTSVLAFDPFCTNWNEGQDCTECILDYVLKNFTYIPEGGTSEVTVLKCQLEKGCLEWDITATGGIGGCTKCQSGYYLYNYSCNKPNTEFCMYSYEKAVLRDSLTNGNNLESGFPCEICDEFRIFDVEQSELEFRCIRSNFFTSAQLVPGCLSFDKNNSGGYDCRECRRNFVLSGNACNQRTYVNTETYYYDQKDRIVSPTNSTVSVAIDGAAAVSWPENPALLTTDRCGVYGPGLRYCLEARSVWVGNVEHKVYPYYDVDTFPFYSTDYIIGDPTKYVGALAMDKTPLVSNFTQYKAYYSVEDAAGTRKDQEPYLWVDTTPITGIYSRKIGEEAAHGFSLTEAQMSIKRIVRGQIRNSKRLATVCETNFFNTHANLNFNYSNLKIGINYNIMNDLTAPFKQYQKLYTDGHTPGAYPCDSTTGIERCTSTRKVISQAIQEIPYISCFECEEGFGVRLTQWLYKNFHGQNNQYHHILSQTDCVKLQNSADPNDIRMPVVANCFYFERTLHHVNNDIIHYCKACNPGSYPNYTTEAPRCPTPCSTLDNGDETYQCDAWYQCARKCPADPCDFESHFCDTNADPIGCEANDKKCCADYISGEPAANAPLDANGDPPANTSDFECGVDTRFKCRRKTCLNNCLDSENKDIGLECNTNTNRCDPKPCSDQNCVCIQGACQPELCRNCGSETTNSTQYCKNVGGTNTCIDYNLCNVDNSASSGGASSGGASSGGASSGGASSGGAASNPKVASDKPKDPFKTFLNERILTTANPATCPPPCEATNTCTYGVFTGYDADANYFGNDSFDYCNYYTGECTRTKSILYFVCSCEEFKEQNWYYHFITGNNNPKVYITKECTNVRVDPTGAHPCICLGTSESSIEGLDLCPADSLPTWDDTTNAGQPCESEAKLVENLALGTFCDWDTYATEKANKDGFQANQQNKAAAEGHLNVVTAEKAKSDGYLATSNTSKDTLETKYNDAQTAKDEGRFGDIAALYQDAKTAYEATATLVADSQTANDTAETEQTNLDALATANPANADVTAAKTSVDAMVQTMGTNDTTIQSNDTDIQNFWKMIQLLHWEGVITQSNTDVTTLGGEITAAKNSAEAEELNAKNEKELATPNAGNLTTHATAAETASTTASTKNGEVETKFQASATAFGELSTYAALPGNATDPSVSILLGSMTSKHGDTETLKDTAKTESDAAVFAGVMAGLYRDVVISDGHKTTTATEETAAAGFAVTAKEEEVKAKAASEEDPVNTVDLNAAVAAAQTAFNSAVTSSTTAAEESDKAKLLKEAAEAHVTTYSGHARESEVEALKEEIKANFEAAEASAQAATASKDEAEADYLLAQGHQSSSRRILATITQDHWKWADLEEKNMKQTVNPERILHTFSNMVAFKEIDSNNERILNTTTTNPPANPNACTVPNFCVTNVNQIPADQYKKKSTYNDPDGGCKFQCKKDLAAKPTITNENATVANGVNDCYNSCTPDLEKCENGACIKQCTVSDPGLSVNCNVNEVCNNSTKVCVPTPCEPACDANYETCNAATNKCTLQARKPTIEALTTCTKVENCEEKFFLNKCVKCLNYYSFKIDATGNTAANPNGVVPALTQGAVPQCIQTNLGNALMASEFVDADGITRYTVEKCAPGYNLDFNNNECVSQIKNCKLNSIEGDCLGCDTPYETATVQLVYGIFEKGFCKTYGEFTPDQQTAMASYYQEKCKYYQYKYNQDPAGSLKHGASVCYECDPDYYFASGNICSLRRTDKCSTYDPATQTGTCLTCEVGYELLNGGAPNQECKEIVNSTKKIPECKIYDTALNCLQCNDGFLFRNTGEGGQTGFCFKAFADEACSIQDEAQFLADGAIKCLKCAKNKGVFYYPRKFTTGINACMFLAPRRLCLDHDFDRSDSLALTNTFNCNLCEQEYYLTNGICIRRLNSDIRGCLVYDPIQDTCKTYESNATTTTVNSDEFSTEPESIQSLLLTPPDYQGREKAVDFGGWILSCEIYKNETTCAQCFAPKYVNPFGFEYNTKCITVTTQVNDCKAYSDAFTCEECFEGYMLMENECFLITVENCATYIDENTCKSCPTQFPYLDEDGNCTVDPRNMFCEEYLISNSAVNLQASKVFECDTCLENYYPNDSSVCTKVESFIRKCKYYAGDGLCKKCHEGYFLNFDGKKCSINPSFDAFCKEFTYSTECTVCEQGYFVDEAGLCKQCNVEVFPENCQYCDPLDNSNCLMCAFGSHMTASGCEKIPTEEEIVFVEPYNYFMQDVKVAQSGISGSK